ncbi:outer membrane beta-barrel family protein [Fluviicola sp.]|jgi:outer membrane receptor protein involved in Fe transport|uniref:outer membrane beta-barrel family protein n=1 Tax=Fluviicola sp. TaxID=1917219 RepID=UPI00281DFE68|nr:outer membrane beta-barrel family protein [Fluviicola sp.]MDR0801899.1 TonB-dependent receptor family protein [Fluviicola sp.]
MRTSFYRNLIIFLLLFPAGGAFAQSGNVTISGMVKNKADKTALPFVQVILKQERDSSFVSGTITDEEGRFSLAPVKEGNYILVFSSFGYKPFKKALYVGTLTDFLDLSVIELEEEVQSLEEVVIKGQTEEVSDKLDKKVFIVENNISQSGGSILQAMQNLPGVTVQDGKVQLRGNDKVSILIDGKQTAITGFGDQYGLDNIPASAIERIEIINNPSSKYDANGNAGIINIIMKKNKQEGFSGKVGLNGGLGALWIKKVNLPTIRPQYQYTPKINPTLSLSYRKNKLNLFFQGDYLYTQTLNKNEFVTRVYDDGTIIDQQTKRNRNTHFANAKLGFDYAFNQKNSLTVSGLYGMEKIIDHGDEPFFNRDSSQRIRLWQFIEDELKTTVMATASYQHKFPQAGHLLSIGFNYTFHRENEKYFFDNIYPTYTGHDAFKLLSDEQVADFNLDYTKPLKYGRLEAGAKFRNRSIPTNMQFYPGLNSPLDTSAGGWANYKELIPAVYGNYIIDLKKVEAEIGLRAEYVRINYLVNPDHNTYKSDGYNYLQPFPTVRFAYKINSKNKLSLFYNRRVDRPNEVDIRIFPKYDDAEIIKVGNPGLRPQFTNSVELSYKSSLSKGYFYAALYGKAIDGTITRISSSVPGSTLIYAIFQNAGKSYNTGVELTYSADVTKWYTLNANGNVYYNQINAFSVENKYPQVNTFSAARQSIYSGNFKLNNTFHFSKSMDFQLIAIYLAPDIIPQGKIYSRFSLDAGLKKRIQKGKGEVFINATDLLNTMVIRKRVQGDGFYYTSSDYYETQVIRIGYSYKF